MIAPAKKSPCHNCERDIGVKQPNGTEDGEFLYCEAYSKIPEQIAAGKVECKKQIKLD